MLGRGGGRGLTSNKIIVDVFVNKDVECNSLTVVAVSSISTVVWSVAAVVVGGGVTVGGVGVWVVAIGTGVVVVIVEVGIGVGLGLPLVPVVASVSSVPVWVSVSAVTSVVAITVWMVVVAVEVVGIGVGLGVSLAFRRCVGNCQKQCENCEKLHLAAE